MHSARSSHPSLKKSPRERAIDGLAKLRRPEALELEIRRMSHPGNGDGAIPRRIVFLRPNPSDSSGDHLFLDELPVPRDAFRFDPHDRILSWRGAFGGGHLHLSHDGRGATGNIGGALKAVAVTGAATAVFDCDVALDCGATYVSSGGAVVGFAWDPTSQAWKSAEWVKDRLQLSYTVTTGGPLQPPTFTFEFTDNQTESVPWDPVEGSFAASLSLGEQGGRMVWNLTFKSAVPPDPDQGNPPSGPDTVYPYWLQAVEDAAAASINGVMEIDGLAPSGKLAGISGVRATPAATGYFLAARGAAPFAVFGGKMMLGGHAVADSRLQGDVLSWRGLSRDHQERTGLPESGSLRFRKDGSVAVAERGGLRARRPSAPAAAVGVAAHPDLHPAAADHLGALGLAATASSSPDMYGLLAMTPYAQGSDGSWGDVVQAAVTTDLGEIMNSFVPSDMWRLIYPNTAQPVLSGVLARVASSPVSGVDDPPAWYQSLATAVFTEGLSGGSDEYCQYLNGPRAAAWLKTQVSTSKVYYTHGQLLFHHEWGQRFPLTAQYLADQVTNAPSYVGAIQNQVIASVDDIQQNVAPDPTNPSMKDDLIAQVKEVGEYALTNNLYWAFAFFTYNTAPSILANIALQMGIATGSSDGTTLSRLFQQNVAVLTSLDASGYFAQQYTRTINIFLATNILPSMFGFTGQADQFDIIKEYLQQFVKTTLESEDGQIREAAAQILAILEAEDAEQILRDSVEALRAFSGAVQDALALPFVANRFLSWFKNKYPRFAAAGSIFGSVLIGGLTGLAIFNLFRDFQDWSELSAAQKAEVILDTVQFSLQILAGVVQRGVRIYAIFGVDGMTATQRVAAVSRILASGEAGQLDQGLVKIGNSAARWLGDTEGTVGKLVVLNDGVAAAVLVNDASVAADEAGWLGKVLGKNLDEFIATRIGPVFILAGIGFSIYSIVEGDKGLALASDILNIVSGSLMLFATLGGWAIEGGLIAAEGLMATIIAVAGPLAILAALAGVGIMIYEMLQKPPDPVKEFVDGYASPAGLAVRSKGSAIDYASSFANPDQDNLLMIGFTLSAGGKTLACDDRGNISLGAGSALPSSVWLVQTDGLGMSQIITVAQPDTTKPPVPLFLTLMSDSSISFQPKYVPPAEGTTPPDPTVLTQTWLSAVTRDARLTSDGKNMVSLDLTFQPVLPDADGNLAPALAKGWLAVTATGVTWAGSGDTFELRMSGMAPNYMRMANLSFILDSTPSSQQSYGPTFGVLPSTPSKYQVSGEALPSFLGFDTTTGTFAPNGGVASTASQTENAIQVSNPLGSAQANFTITVSAAAPPPSARIAERAV